MPDTSSCSYSEVHARAICDEVGERLRNLARSNPDANAAEIVGAASTISIA